MEERNIILDGKNCWKTAQAERAAILVDGAAYYTAFYETVKRAGNSIFILGWDIDSRLSLIRDSEPRELPVQLGKFLNAKAQMTPGLHIYVLVWDFAMIYAFEREFLPVFKLGWRTHRRLHFLMDGGHPMGAAHHQKMVVIDDKVAFVGGLDLSRSRWDTPSHNIYDPRRIDPNGFHYGAFHDIMMAVDGKAAEAVGELARMRWKDAAGKEARRKKASGHDPWPPYLKADFKNVPISIARTEPAFNGRKEVREVQALYLDAIKAARRCIFIENQYFTSTLIGEALIERLQEKNGPEVVAVVPCQCSGWLEDSTMGVLRERLLRLIRAGDRYGRFRAYCPGWSSTDEHSINVHSKVLIVDEDFLRIGSSNLSNRSMGLDTECDLAVEANGREEVVNGIVGFRNKLLGEHLGVSPERVSELMAEKGSLIETVEALCGGERTLRPVEDKAPIWLDNLIPDSAYVDPERPVDPDELIAKLAPEEVQESGRERILRGVVILLFLICLAAIWHWTPLREWVNADSAAYWMTEVKQSRLAPLIVMVVYMVGGLVMFPVTLLIFGTAVAFEPLQGFVYSLTGCILSAVLTYSLGNMLGRKTIRRLAGSPLNRLSRRLARRGVITVATLRILPVAPYTILNMVAGASHIRFRDFLVGTVIGMAPGIFMITIIGNNVHKTVMNPNAENFTLLFSILIFLIAVIIWTRRWVAGREVVREVGDAPCD
jgi:phosphatidylserine/phosphatidylglycerophosphate/cardiolipin synthase-like enzyme/uncharacterized membrane protein YdjX (TVP38/TMEM64 family)